MLPKLKRSSVECPDLVPFVWLGNQIKISTHLTRTLTVYAQIVRLLESIKTFIPLIMRSLILLRRIDQHSSLPDLKMILL